MKNIYTCNCLLDDFLKKTTQEILVTFENNHAKFADFIRFNVNDNFYVFCPWITEFCFKADRWYFYDKTCGNRTGEWCHLCCFHLLKFGFKTICQVCIFPLQKKLFPFLIKVK